MNTQYAFNTFTDASLVEFAKQRLDQARKLGREQAQHQREADAARKEIKRRRVNVRSA